MARNSLRIIFIDTLLGAGEGHKVYYWISVSWMEQAKVNKFPECENFYNVKWVFLNHPLHYFNTSTSASRRKQRTFTVIIECGKDGVQEAAVVFVQLSIFGWRNNLRDKKTLVSLIGKRSVVSLLLRWAEHSSANNKRFGGGITSDPGATSSSLFGVNYDFQELI